MAYTAPETVVTGDLATAALHNTQIVASIKALYAGEMSVASQAIGDLLYAASTTQLARLADVATGQALMSGGIGTVPAWSGSPAFSGTLTASGFGAHTFSGTGNGDLDLALHNTNAGAAASNRVTLTTAAYSTMLNMYGDGFTSSGITQASGALLYNNGPGGLNVVAAHASGVIRFYSGGTTLRATLQTAGTWTWAAYGAGALSSDASGNITASDARLKTITGPYRGGLAEMLRLHPSVYRWNTESGWDTDHEYIGFTAQDVEQALPGAVPGFDLDSGKRLNYDDRAILAATANAFREVEARLKALEERTH